MIYLTLVELLGRTRAVLERDTGSLREQSQSQERGELLQFGGQAQVSARHHEVNLLKEQFVFVCFET